MVVELSINSVVGLYNPGTMKVKGELQERSAIVLIDCGSTHNFISEKLVKELQLKTKETSNYGVILGSGTAVKGKGICEAVELMFGDWKVVDEFLLLELGGVDVTLGMQWLYSLGTIEVDWKNLLLTFTHKGKKVRIQGDPSLTKASVSLKKMMKTLGEEDQGFLVECRALERSEVWEEENLWEEELTVEESMAVILKSFEDVFEWPETLPPRITIEHHIHLKKEVDPVNVRPYRYAHQQKNEMERLVEEILSSGIIRPSTSPYSSHVLLVRKKGWELAFLC